MKIIKSSGFTLIEIMVVLGIAAAIGALGLGFGLSSIARNICQTQLDLVYSALFEARTKAITLGEMGESIMVDFEELDLVDGFSVTSEPREIIFTKTEIGVRSENSEIQLHGPTNGPTCENQIKLNNVGAIL